MAFFKNFLMKTTVGVTFLHPFTGVSALQMEGVQQTEAATAEDISEQRANNIKALSQCIHDFRCETLCKEEAECPGTIFRKVDGEPVHQQFKELLDRMPKEDIVHEDCRKEMVYNLLAVPVIAQYVEPSDLAIPWERYDGQESILQRVAAAPFTCLPGSRAPKQDELELIAPYTTQEDLEAAFLSVQNKFSFLKSQHQQYLNKIVILSKYGALKILDKLQIDKRRDSRDFIDEMLKFELQSSGVADVTEKSTFDKSLPLLEEVKKFVESRPDSILFKGYFREAIKITAGVTLLDPFTDVAALQVEGDGDNEGSIEDLVGQKFEGTMEEFMEPKCEEGVRVVVSDQRISAEKAAKKMNKKYISAEKPKVNENEGTADHLTDALRQLPVWFETMVKNVPKHGQPVDESFWPLARDVFNGNLKQARTKLEAGADLGKQTRRTKESAHTRVKEDVQREGMVHFDSPLLVLTIARAVPELGGQAVADASDTSMIDLLISHGALGNSAYAGQENRWASACAGLDKFSPARGKYRYEYNNAVRMACEGNQIELLKALLNAGAQADMYFPTARKSEAEQAELAAVKKMTEDSWKLIDQYFDSQTPLETVRTFVESGVPVNAVHCHGKSVLYHAAERKDFATVEYLLAEGADFLREYQVLPIDGWDEYGYEGGYYINGNIYGTTFVCSPLELILQDKTPQWVLDTLPEARRGEAVTWFSENGIMSYEDRVSAAGDLIKLVKEQADEADLGSLKEIALKVLSSAHVTTQPSAFHSFQDEQPLSKVYDQDGPECWAHSSSSVFAELFLQWFREEGLGLSQLFPFEFVKSDEDIHDILVKLAIRNKKSGGNMFDFTLYVGPIIGALMGLFGGQQHHALAREWMDGGLLKQFRFETFDVSKGENIQAYVEELGNVFPMELTIYPDAEGAHSVALVEKKGPGKYRALNSWGTEHWSPDKPDPIYQDQRESDDKDGFFTVDFSLQGVSSWRISRLLPPSSEVHQATLEQCVYGHPVQMMDFVTSHLDIFPEGLDTCISPVNCRPEFPDKTPLLLNAMWEEDDTLVDQLIHRGASLTYPILKAMLKKLVNDQYEEKDVSKTSRYVDMLLQSDCCSADERLLLACEANLIGRVKDLVVSGAKITGEKRNATWWAIFSHQNLNMTEVLSHADGFDKPLDQMYNILVERATHFNVLDSDGNSPLHHATQYHSRNEFMLPLLLQNANYKQTIDMLNVNDDSALAIACKNRDIEAATLLVQHGASMDLLNDDDRLWLLNN